MKANRDEILLSRYLDGDLAVGTEFSMQLVPDLADDIWLYGRIWSE